MYTSFSSQAQRWHALDRKQSKRPREAWNSDSRRCWKIKKDEALIKKLKEEAAAQQKQMDDMQAQMK